MTHQIAETLSPLCWWGCDRSSRSRAYFYDLQRIEKFGNSTVTIAVLGLFSNDSSARVMFLDKIHTTAERRCKLSILSGFSCLFVVFCFVWYHNHFEVSIQRKQFNLLVIHSSSIYHVRCVILFISCEPFYVLLFEFVLENRQIWNVIKLLNIFKIIMSKIWGYESMYNSSLKLRSNRMLHPDMPKTNHVQIKQAKLKRNFIQQGNLVRLSWLITSMEQLSNTRLLIDYHTLMLQKNWRGRCLMSI